MPILSAQAVTSQLLCGEPASRPQLIAKDPQCKHPDHAGGRETREQAHAGRDSEVDVERVREVYRARGERRAHKVVAREQASGVLRIGEGEVEEDALDDNEDAESEYGNADGWHNPVNRGPGRPCYFCI